MGAVQRLRPPLRSGSCLTGPQGPGGFPADPLQPPLSAGAGALVCLGQGLWRQEGVLRITNGSFQRKPITDTIFPKGVSLEAWNF